MWLAAAALGMAACLGAAEPKTLVFFGDSLTAGYGIDPDQAFPALIQARIEAAGLPWRVVTAGLSGETSAGGLRRVDWVLRQPVDLFVLELGANDGLRGIDPATTRANLDAILQRVHERRPGAKTVVVGMRMPLNLGRDYSDTFAGIFPAVAAAHQSALVPFLLENVGGQASLNLGDGIHPNPEGHKIVAKNVWRILEPLLAD